MNILIVVTGSDHVTGKDGRKYPAQPPEEFLAPYRLLQRFHYKTVLATPGGRQEGLRRLKEAAELADPRSLGSIDDRELESFDAVFFPDGYGALEDLADNGHVSRLLRHCHDRRKPTALTGHGCAALLSARQGEQWPYRGYTMTAFSDSEEKKGPLHGPLAYSLEGELRKNGAQVATGPDFLPLLREDRELLTGQNPASAGLVAQALIRRLEEAAAAAG